MPIYDYLLIENVYVNVTWIYNACINVLQNKEQEKVYENSKQLMLQQVIIEFMNRRLNDPIMVVDLSKMNSNTGI